MKKSLVFIMIILLMHSIYSQKVKKTPKYEVSDTELNSIINSQKPFNISVLGNGNIQKSFESGEDIPANTGVGISIQKFFYEEYKESNNTKYKNQPFWGLYMMTLDVTINIASTLDTLKSNVDDSLVVQNQSDFGSSILTPLNSGQAVDIDFNGYFKRTYLRGFISGVQIRYIGSNRNWNINDGTRDITKQVSMNMFRAGIFHDFVVAELRNDYAVKLGVAYAYNSIRGDFGLSKNDALRQELLGATKDSFHGLEINLGMRLKNVKAGFAYSIFPTKAEIPGLTGGRMVTSIGFVGGFSLDVVSKKDDNDGN